MNLMNEIAQLKTILKSPAQKSYSTHFILSLIDFTNLTETESTKFINEFCLQVTYIETKVAAICLYPQFIKKARELLHHKDIKIATVANFPTGMQDLSSTLIQINFALEQGADEIDLVMPYHTFLEGDLKSTRNFILSCKAGCGSGVALKVILETGALQNVNLIYQAAELAIEAGADFLKTSTGKISTGATIEGTATLLYAIKNSQKLVGCKIAGGIRNKLQAIQYLRLTELIMGENWVTPQVFRFGSSSLLTELSLPIFENL